MPTSAVLGEWEQLLLLSALRLGDRAAAVQIRRDLTAVIGRPPSRGALYRTLDRLEDKGYVRWAIEAASADRGGHARRVYTVTPIGIGALRVSRRTLLGLWKGVEGVLK